MARRSETTDYDPRYDRPQTVGGAKARYLDDDLEYDETDLEADLERLFEAGEWPDSDVVYNGTPVPPTVNNPDRNASLYETG